MVTPNQIADIIRQIADSGINRAQLQALRESGRLSALLREYMEDESSEPNTYTVTVDYDQPLADMIKAGRYDWTNVDITVEHFPVKKRESGEVELHVVHFGRSMTTKEVLVELDKRGLRPAELPELLALGAAHPDLQRKYSLVALGSGWQNPVGGVDVPFLLGHDGRRSLNLDWNDPGHRWYDGCRFVAVSK